MKKGPLKNYFLKTPSFFSNKKNNPLMVHLKDNSIYSRGFIQEMDNLGEDPILNVISSQF